MMINSSHKCSDWLILVVGACYFISFYCVHKGSGSGHVDSYQTFHLW